MAGRTRIQLRKTGEVFSLVPPNSKAHNVIMGRTWVDCYGNFQLVNTTTGAKCLLYFTPCGWFSSGRYQVGRLCPAACWPLDCCTPVEVLLAGPQAPGCRLALCFSMKCTCLAMLPPRGFTHAIVQIQGMLRLVGCKACLSGALIPHAMNGP